MKKIIFILLVLSMLYACKKDIIDSNKTATLHFSTDTITFDTIFASIGSITKTLTVYNNNDFSVQTDIELKGSSVGNFRMNVDGIAGDAVKNVEISAKDSIFIFLEVTINPSSNNTPYILTDSLIFTTGTKKQDINLVAWGQDAYFHTANTFGQIIDGTDTIIFPYHQVDCTLPWENDKPHVIYGYAIIDAGQTLNINAGCNIFLHKNSGILVGNPFSGSSGSSIKVNGTLGNEVTFQGDRLDPWYKDIPGQWDRIWIMPGSVNNEINYTIIKNGNIGIHADSLLENETTVEINNTIIENMSSIGILGQGASITATNTLVSRCGQYTVACNIGGDYNFTHCTFANYWNYNHRNTPSILLNNYYEGADGQTYLRNLTAANFTNCIVYGSLSTEISFQKEESAVFNYMFNHCLIKLDPTISTNNLHYTNAIINQSPNFIDAYENNFHLTENSPAIDVGISTFITVDIEGNIRNNPDLGAFEFQE